MGPRGAAVPRLPFPLMQSPGNYPNPAPGWCRGTDVTARERGRGTRGRHGHKAGTGAVAPAHAAGTGTRGGAGGAVCSPSAAAPALPWRGTGAAGGSCGRWGARGTTGCLIMALPLAPPRVRHPDPCPAAAQGSAWTPPSTRGHWSPRLSLVVWPCVQPAEPAALGPKAGRSVWGPDGQRRDPRLPPAPVELHRGTPWHPAFAAIFWPRQTTPAPCLRGQPTIPSAPSSSAKPAVSCTGTSWRQHF